MRHLSTVPGCRGLVGLEGGLRAIGAVLDRVVAAPSTVLILGETGTGKELLAREIHARSARCKSPFIAVSCAALPDGLLESELFGHESGAFTGAQRRRIGRFEVAQGGTLFLDEVAQISAHAQVTLLRVLQEREFERLGSSLTRPADVRILAASNVSLEERVSLGLFRQDLYYRLSVIEIVLPPLRERREDISPLATTFLEQISAELGKRVDLSGDARRALERYPWPGNARELRNVLERAVVFAAPEAVLTESDLRLPPGIDKQEASLVVGIRHQATLDSVRTIAEALRAARGNKADAARRLGIPRTTLHDSMKRLKLG